MTFRPGALLIAAALALTAPLALTACGADTPTDAVDDAAAGADKPAENEEVPAEDPDDELVLVDGSGTAMVNGEKYEFSKVTMCEPDVENLGEGGLRFEGWSDDGADRMVAEVGDKYMGVDVDADRRPGAYMSLSVGTAEPFVYGGDPEISWEPVDGVGLEGTTAAFTSDGAEGITDAWNTAGGPIEMDAEPDQITWYFSCS